MKIRPYFSLLMLVAIPLCFSVRTYAQNTAPQANQTVTLYEFPNFGGRSKSFGVGRHTLTSAEDFNNIASSIRVPKGMAVIVAEDAGPFAGYGLYVDFLEDQPDLKKYNLDKKISHLAVFTKRSREGGSWVRNHKEAGEFKTGYWHMGRSLPPEYPDPVVGTRPGPTKPPPPPPTCTVSGTVKNDLRKYGTRITLYLNGSPTQLSATVSGETYTISNVPQGTYEVRGSGGYPRGTTPSGKPTGLDIFADGSQIMECKDGRSKPVNFFIGPIEG